MSHEITRRRFIQSTAALAIATPVLAATTEPEKAKLKLAIIGTGGRGMDHVREISKLSEADVIALCDCDSNMLANATKVIPSAKTFADFRDVLKIPDLQAVVIATPDHMHAPISAAALRAGKHVYCEKPLAHTVKESRDIADLARQTRLVTQLGIQIHSLDNYRRVVEIVQSGAIGKVSEVHIWNNRTRRPPETDVVDPIPPNFNYDLWLGPVSRRPLLKGYHPYNWREWWSFGSGLLGDIACHLLDVAFWSLDLKHPTKIEAAGTSLSPELCAHEVIAKFQFPGVTLTWYDPPHRPKQIADWKLDEKLTGEGVMFIGDAGMLCTDYMHYQLLPADKFKTYQRRTTRIVSSPGHQLEWIRACTANDPSAVGAPFSYGSLLTECALLGVVAIRAGEPIEWDWENRRIPNLTDAEKYLDYPHREGWNV